MIAIGSDHGGYKLKEEIKKYLEEKEIKYKDFGCINENSRSPANEEGRKHGRRGNSTLLSTFAML